MNTVTKLLPVTILVFALTSCALQPIVSQYDYQKNKTETIDLDGLGNGRILIYNGADGWHKIDNTARLNMWLNDKPMGQIRAGEYAIIELNEGSYDFKLLHIDMVKFVSLHKATIDHTTKVILIKPTPTSNKLTITNELPGQFANFRYVERR